MQFETGPRSRASPAGDYAVRWVLGGRAVFVAGLVKRGGSEIGLGGLSTSPSALNTLWSRAREGKMKSRKEEESQIVRVGQGHRTCWHRTFTLQEMVSHCGLLSRGVPRDELYVNRSSVAALLWEDHRD